ncbi:MAG: SurA N-terminal domain-containing protein [Candidatus Omnitrophica bacterium]|nr:SurA N-terminal domain-containing protein [Candidatus Omnitrophota bacterium]
MLNNFRSHHTKRIIWILAIVIIAAFGLSGAGFYLSGRDKNILGKIGGEKITISELQEAIRMAKLQALLSGGDSQSLTPLDFERIGLDFLTLIWKANQEKIKVTNEEVKNYVINNIFGQKRFNQETYQNFLQAISRRYNLNLNARMFEEHIRSFIKIDKLFQEHATVEVKPEEIKELYLRDTQKATIAYLAINYNKFKVDIGIAPSEIETFYEENKALFEKEAKINIAYVLIENDNPKISAIINNLKEIRTLAELASKFSLKIKETGLIKLSDPIEDIGWQYKITEVAFSLDKNTLGPPLETEKGILLIEKTDQESAFIPVLSEIESEVKEKLILEEAKKQAKSFSQELLDKINNQSLKNLKKLAGQENITYKEPEPFKFYDYIEGLGLDPEISNSIFSLKNGEVEPRLFIREKAIYIVQLKELTEINDADFQKKKDTYRELLAKNKAFSKRIQFLQRVKQEANLNLNPLR